MKLFMKSFVPVFALSMLTVGLVYLTASAETGSKVHATDANSIALAQKATGILDRCVGCHNHGFAGPDGKSRISWGKDVPQMIKQGLVTPGQPDKSPLALKIATLKHPKQNPATADEAKAFVEWIKQGALDPNAFTSRPAGKAPATETPHR